MYKLIRSIDENGNVTAVIVTKPGIIETEPGHVIIKNGFKYVLTRRNCCCGAGPAYTEQRWKLIDVVNYEN